MKSFTRSTYFTRYISRLFGHEYRHKNRTAMADTTEDCPRKKMTYTQLGMRFIRRPTAKLVILVGLLALINGNIPANTSFCA